jgi:hypothetical protein
MLVIRNGPYVLMGSILKQVAIVVNPATIGVHVMVTAMVTAMVMGTPINPSIMTDQDSLR